MDKTNSEDMRGNFQYKEFEPIVDKYLKVAQKKQEKNKAKCALIDQNGNIFNLMGIASRELRRNGLEKQADEMVDRITKSHDYYEALNIISDYVDITDGEYKGDEKYEDDFENEY